jgi:hypothetical protein
MRFAGFHRVTGHSPRDNRRSASLGIIVARGGMIIQSDGNMLEYRDTLGD